MKNIVLTVEPTNLSNIRTMYIPYGTTYNDLIKEFSKQYRVRQEGILKKLKLGFHPLTGCSVNALVTVDSYQDIINAFDNSGYDQACFASFLKLYKWKTPLQAECGDEGYTFAEWLEHDAQVSAKLDGFDSDVDEEIEEAFDQTPTHTITDSGDVYPIAPKSLKPLKVIDVFTEAFGENKEAYRRMKNYIKADWGQCSHPWTVLELSHIYQLKMWLGAYYPAYGGLCGSNDERFKADYLQT